MFGLFKSPPFHDPALGEFLRARGAWRGSVSLPAQQTVPLVLAGSRTEPDTRALTIARSLAAGMVAWRPIVAEALLEHREPYAADDDEDKDDSSGTPSSATRAGALDAEQVWSHVNLVFVSVLPLDGQLTVELGYATTWDEEHTLGARFCDGRWVELCGSVVEP
jgi:hypothetical protein